MKPSISPLPPVTELTTKPILLAVIEARAAIGELKGRASSFPNERILVDSLPLQEALASSEIENIVTTQDEAFQANLFSGQVNPAAKEVDRYRKALWQGYQQWTKNQIISENMLIAMYRTLKLRNDGYRAVPGAVLRDNQSGEVVYTPPQTHEEIVRYMRALEKFINDEPKCDLDPLIKMAIIHHQFESIHPFPDGNGRIGRMLNVLYLTHTGLLNYPILHLSRAINQTKQDYYRLLQAVRKQDEWEEWVLYILDAVMKTTKSTLNLISKMHQLMLRTKHEIRDQLPRIYSQGLLNNLFRYPYTRIEYMENDIPYSRQTARKYLKQLTRIPHKFFKKVFIIRYNDN